MKDENESGTFEETIGAKIEETCDSLGLASTDKLRNSIFQDLATEVTPARVLSAWKKVCNPPLPRTRRKGGKKRE